MAEATMGHSRAATAAAGPSGSMTQGAESHRKANGGAREPACPAPPRKAAYLGMRQGGKGSELAVDLGLALGFAMGESL